MAETTKDMCIFRFDFCEKIANLLLKKARILSCTCQKLGLLIKLGLIYGVF